MSPCDYHHVTECDPPSPCFEVWRRGRKPQGERALTGAKRQASYRQCRPITARRRRGAHPAEPPRSRPQQWHAPVAIVLGLQVDYGASLDMLRDGATSEALQAIVDLDLETNWLALSCRDALGETDSAASRRDRAAARGSIVHNGGARSRRPPMDSVDDPLCPRRFDRQLRTRGSILRAARGSIPDVA
jgi:hypothetical protein